MSSITQKPNTHIEALVTPIRHTDEGDQRGETVKLRFTAGLLWSWRGPLHLVHRLREIAVPRRVERR